MLLQCSDKIPRDQVTNKNIEAISQIIDSKEHLQCNIEDFRFENISSWELGNRKYKHQIAVLLKVKTAQLWESPISYFWRHLGSSTWTLQDGTEASLIRIHQKWVDPFSSSFFRGFLGGLPFHMKSETTTKWSFPT